MYHWTARHPEWEGPVSAYAIDDGERLILIDPIAVPDNVRALFGSREVVIVLTSTWHERDAATLGFPVWAPAPDRPDDELVPATRYTIGDSLFGMEAYPGREGQLDLVLWSERIRAVIAGDTLIDLGNGLEIPASWLPEGVTVEQVAGRAKAAARQTHRVRVADARRARRPRRSRTRPRLIGASPTRRRPPRHSGTRGVTPGRSDTSLSFTHDWPSSRELCRPSAARAGVILERWCGSLAVAVG